MAKQGSARNYVGSPDTANVMNGISSYMRMDNAKFTKHGEKVFPTGVGIMNTESGVVYIADGTTKLKELKPRIDQVLTAAEKKALSEAFKNGSYAIAAGGVVVFGSDKKIDDAAFKFIEGGKISKTYLSDIIDSEGKIKVDILPATVRAGFSFFENYQALLKASEEQKKGFCFVADASGDDTVNSGWALYIWTTESSGKWVKVAEGEGLDVTTDMFVSYKSVAAVGAVMYDHFLFLKGADIDDVAPLLDSLSEPTLNISDISGTAQSEQAFKPTFGGTRTSPFYCTVTPKGCSIKGMATDPTEVADGVTKELNMTIANATAEFTNAKVVVGSTNGTVTIKYMGITKVVNVTKA